MGEPRATARRFGEWLAAAAMTAAVLAVYRVFQPTVSRAQGLGWDGVYYFSLAVQFIYDHPLTTAPPFVFRIGVPFLVSFFPFDDPRTSFLWLGLGANLVTVAALVVLLGRHVEQAWARLAVLAMFLLEWHAPLRRLFYNAAHVDFVAMIFLVGGLLGCEEVARRRSLAAVAALAAWSFCGALVHESTLVVAIALLFVRFDDDPRRAPEGDGRRVPQHSQPAGRNGPPSHGLLWLLRGGLSGRLRLALPLLAGGLSLVWSRTLVTAQDAAGGNFHFRHAWEMLSGKSPLWYPLAWFVAFGPLVVLPLADARNSARFLRGQPHLAVYLLAFAVLSYIGGTDTERILYWSFPVVYLLIGRALGNFAPVLRRRWALAMLLAAGQLVSERVFWPTPDEPSAFADRHPFPILTPWGDRFPLSDLFSFNGPPAMLLAALVQYLVLAAVTVWGLLWPLPPQSRGAADGRAADRA